MTATLTTLVSFGSDGEALHGALIMDAKGDLFGTTEAGGGSGFGTVFEVAKTPTGYANTPTTLASFNGADGDGPYGGLIADADGDLFGTTARGGADRDSFTGFSGDGTVFEIEKTSTGYASTPTTLVSFNGADGSEPKGSLIVDPIGDLLGTTAAGGAFGAGTVFEIAKTAGGYASTPTSLASFDPTPSGPEGGPPNGTLIADANGDLFGTAQSGGAFGDPANAGYGPGTVFEIAKTSAGYASTPTTLVSFNVANGALPEAGPIADSNGDLFGTTDSGPVTSTSTYGIGTVFEVAKTAAGYASTATTLVNFNGYDNYNPDAPVIADAKGDLFGTTFGDASTNLGTVFEIMKTAAGYATTPITLVSFNATNDVALDGAEPQAGLIADANGDLFGTTSGGGPNGEGTVFEITGSGFVPVIPPPPPPTGPNAILFQNVSGQVAIWDVSGATLSSGALLGANPGPSWQTIGTGDFNDDTHPDVLLQNANGAIAIWETNGASLTGSALVANPGPSWKAVGTGDFNDDGHSDILLQNANGAVAIWEMNGTSLKSSAVVANPGPSWKVVGTGDFNDDGDSDILLQNANGAVAIWEMNGTSLKSSALVATPAPSWKVVGTGDFNGDGHSDILLQNADGRIAIWEMNGASISPDSGIVSTDPGPSWHALGTNHGGADILFQSTSGQTAIWDMSGTTLTGAGAVSANAGPSWRAVGLT